MVDVAHPRPLRGDQALAVGAFLRRLDWVLLLAVAALVLLGLWAISGITRDDVPGDPDYYLVRQAVFAGLGAAGLVLAILVDPDVYRRHLPIVYGVMLALLLLVFAAGEVTRGSRRWVELGFFTFQPSEFGKLLLALSLAAFLSGRMKRLNELTTILATVGLALLPTLLVFVQPDVGTSLVYMAALAAALFVAGIRWLILGALAAAALLATAAVLWVLPAAGVEVLKPYQVARLTGFTNPDEDPGGLTYNLTQSKTAVGAGGVHGRGVEGATQTNLDYLPEHATDFVFASYAEQRGFVGAAVLLALYLLVVWRGLRIVAIARDAFSAIAVAAVIVAFLFQVFVNVGMTIGMAPITGIPLPFMSVGGSSMISNLIAIGVLQAICARSRAHRRR